MDDANPYEAPQSPSVQTPRKRYENPRDKWLGILGIVGGIALLLVTAYTWFALDFMLTWTLGGGIAILAIGAMRLKVYFDDKKYSQAVNNMLDE